jgi:hypothetical protein
MWRAAATASFSVPGTPPGVTEPTSLAMYDRESARAPAQLRGGPAADTQQVGVQPHDNVTTLDRARLKCRKPAAPGHRTRLGAVVIDLVPRDRKPVQPSMGPTAWLRAIGFIEAGPDGAWHTTAMCDAELARLRASSPLQSGPAASPDGRPHTASGRLAWAPTWNTRR